MFNKQKKKSKLELKNYFLKKKLEIKELLKKSLTKTKPLLKNKKKKHLTKISLHFIYSLLKNIRINNRLLRFLKLKKLKKLNLKLYNAKLEKIQNFTAKANLIFLKNYYYMYNKDILNKMEHSAIVQRMLSKPKKRRKLTNSFLILENLVVGYAFKVSLLKSILFFMFPKKVSDSILFPYLVRSTYQKSRFRGFSNMFDIFLKNQSLFDLMKFKHNIVKKFSIREHKVGISIHSFLKENVLKEFLFRFIKKKYHSVAHIISLAPWGKSNEKEIFSNHNRRVFKEAAKYKLPLQQYLYTKAKIVANIRWALRRHKHFYNKKLVWNFKKSFAKVKVRRKNWFPLYKLGKFWQRFRKKPYNWVSNDWKNKFFRMVKRPLTNFPTKLTRDVEKGIIYRSRNLRSNRFRTKFIIRRYLKKKFFSNKLSSVNQFLKSKYKKKKCTFWEKTYQHLFGRLDVMLCWYGFSPSLRKARKLIKQKHVYINGKCASNWKIVLDVKDMLYVRNLETFFNSKVLSAQDYPSLLVRRFKQKLMFKLSKFLIRIGVEWNFKKKIYAWWKSFVKNLRIFKRPREGRVPNWVSAFLKKYGYRILGYRNLNSSRFMLLLNKFYFARERKFLYQRLVANSNSFNLKKSSLDYFLSDVGARSLIIGEDRVRNREEKKKDKDYKPIEELLSTYSNYLTPLDENLLQNRYSSPIHKSTNFIRCIEESKFSPLNYFKLSKFKNGNYNMPKDIYMFFLSRVFY